MKRYKTQKNARFPETSTIPQLTGCRRKKSDGEWFSQALNGRFLQFAPNSHVSPQNRFTFHPIYQESRFGLRVPGRVLVRLPIDHEMVGVVFSLIPKEGAGPIAIRAALAALSRKKSSCRLDCATSVKVYF